MSQDYNSLTDTRKVEDSLHFSKGKLNSALQRLTDAFQHQFDELYKYTTEIVQKAGQVNHAMSTDLDKIGKLFDLKRVAGESDNDLRTRIANHVATFETVTPDGILTMFEIITGRRPYLGEDFETVLYKSGDVVDPTPGGEFYLLFNIPYTVAYEVVPVQVGGTSVTVSNSIEPILNTTVSVTTSVSTSDTTIYVDSVTNFQTENGEIKIDDEYIKYGSALTSPERFEDCTRGMYDSVPATHNTATSVNEALTIAWLHGSNNVIYSSHTGNTVYLSGGTYPEGDLVSVRYKVQIEETLESLITKIDSLRAAGYEYAAAGIKASIAIGLILESYYAETMEELEVNEILDLIAVLFTESKTIDSNNNVFYESSDWDGAIWDANRWDTTGTPSGDYYLFIEFGEPGEFTSP